MKFNDWSDLVEKVNYKEVIDIAKSVRDNYTCNKNQISDCPTIIDEVCKELNEHGIKCKVVNGVFKKNEEESFSHSWILIGKFMILDPTLSQFGFNTIYLSHPDWEGNGSISKSQYIRKKNRKINLGGNFTFQ